MATNDITRQKRWILKNPLYRKFYRLANRDKMNQQKRQLRNKNRVKYMQIDREKLSINKDIIAQFKFQPCSDCNVQYDPFIMHFDHREPKYKIRSISRMGTYSLRTVLSEISKCDVVCANCHGLRTLKGVKMGKIKWFGRIYGN